MSKKPTLEELEQMVKKLDRAQSEGKQTEETLRESEERYRAVVESQTEMICRFLPDGTLTFVNEAYCRFFGNDSEELIGHKFMPLIPEIDRDKVFENITSLNPDTSVITHEHRVLAPNGEIYWHKWNNQAIFDDQNKLIEFQSVGWDITNRVIVEQALRESEKNFRALAENANDGILIAVEDGRHIFANNRSVEITGYSVHELLKMTIRDLAHPDEFEKIKKRYKKIIAGKSFQRHYETMIIRKDGKEVPIEVASAKFTWHGQPADIVIVRDISERKRVEEELRKAHDKLEYRVKERTRELELKTKNLEEINTAMKVLLKKREEDKTEIEDNVLTNVKELVEPYFQKINKTKLDAQQEAFLSIIESNLNEIISPFARKMSLKYLNLTPSEIQIANLIRYGSTTKKIAELLNISPRTVETHRKNIRRKIGLEHKRANLRSHLLSLH